MISRKPVSSARPQRRRKVAALALALGLLTTVSTVGAASPTQIEAAQTQAVQSFGFEIFYGPNCYAGRTAFRHYEGYNASESWVNDTFNGDLQGNSAGYGQKIRNNAASIYLRSAHVGIYINGQSQISTSYAAGRTHKCINFSPAVRNHNTGWQTAFYGAP